MRLRACLPALCATAALAGCGDGNGDEGPAVTVPAGTPLTVTGDEYSFKPSKVVTGGGELRIVLVNEGSLAHNLKLERGGSEVGGTATFPGDQKRDATVRLRPGEYRMVCTVGNHEQLGMTGTLTVR